MVAAHLGHRKVKFMVMNDRLISFLSNVNQPSHSWHFLSNVNNEMLTLCGQQHSFSTHERGFLWKCQSFWGRKCLDLRGTRTPNLQIHAECSNLLSYQGQTFAVKCDGNIWGTRLNWYACFSFRSNWTPFAWDTANSKLSLEIHGEGQDENQSKSAASDSGRMNQYKNIKSPSVYQDDSITFERRNVLNKTSV